MSDTGQPDPATPSPPTRDKPWVMRTYSGHSTAKASNELYRTNLAKGQTGLSIAFDLPTQIGYDPDDPAAAGEVGKVGVPVAHLGHMAELLDQIPVESMNTSMTINATAAWLLGLYIANAEARGVDPRVLSGTTQNDIVKEYLSRGTFIFPPLPSRRLTVDTIAYTVRHVPRWNPINVCSYHLQEAGATPHQEVAYALATAIGVLDAVRESGQIPEDEFPAVVGRISFFVNAGVRFVEETCKMRAFTELWDRVCAERYGVTDPKLRRMRYGVQVNSLGLTEAQPENNIQRIVLESLGVTLSKKARARALQLPAWNEALGLPRPWDQQWSLRIQQVLAFESDLLEYGDIFDGSVVIEEKTAEVAEASWAELEDVLALGGAFEAIDELKSRLVGSQSERVRRIETGELQVVGVNCFTETADSPLASAGGEGGSIMRVDPAVESHLKEDVRAWRAARDARRRPAGPRRPAARRRGHRQRDARHHRPGPRRGHHRRVGRRPAGGLRRVPGPDRGERRRRPPRRRVPGRARPLPGAGRPGRRAAPAAGGQAGPRRPLQRRRADRRGRPRCRLRGRLPGHPPLPRRDRGGRPGRGRRRGRDLDPVRKPPRAGPRGGRAAAGGRGGRAGRGRRDHPPRGRVGPAGQGRGRVYTPKDFEIGQMMDDMIDLVEQHRAAAVG